MADVHSILDDPRVAAYLAALRTGLAGAKPEQATAILGDVRAHIAEAAADDLATGRDVDVEAILRSLGPAELVAAGAERMPQAPASVAPPPRPSFVDSRAGAVLTVLLLTIGGFVVPIIGWIAGIFLLWVSRGWELRHKIIGTIAVPGALLAVVVFGLLPWAAFGETTVTVCESDGFCPPQEANPLVPGFSHVGLLVALFVVPIVVSIWLLVAHREPDTRR